MQHEQSQRDKNELHPCESWPQRHRESLVSDAHLTSQGLVDFSNLMAVNQFIRTMRDLGNCLSIVVTATADKETA